ncbi:hypothetical protein [Falsiroseomonas oryzae]|uniref:hypothetical protein n=1 Tax=Falsiroseomonas oryzae TaxID=2766473 RepID=UPI0022EAC369|nr:hypothetical protein [Roseomonas sp. MO-31]
MPRQSRFAWVCLGALGLAAAALWAVDKRNAALGTVLAVLGCVFLILPPRERMARLPWRLRALPRRYDATPVLASLISTPGYGLSWFHGANPYDEAVHLLSGLLAGAVVGALLQADGRPRSALRLAMSGGAFGLALSLAWEAFEWWAGLIGNGTDTLTDILLTTLGTALAAALVPAAQASRPR